MGIFDSYMDIFNVHVSVFFNLNTGSDMFNSNVNFDFVFTRLITCESSHVD